MFFFIIWVICWLCDGLELMGGMYEERRSDGQKREKLRRVNKDDRSNWSNARVQLHHHHWILLKVVEQRPEEKNILTAI